MKNLLCTIVMTLLFKGGFCQKFSIGSSDPENDPVQMLAPDAKSIWYAVDIQQDSLWFKMEFYERIDLSEWNVKIGLDTNNNLVDGGTWQGKNSSMKYDLLFDIYHNPNFPPPFTTNILDDGNNFVSNNLRAQIQDTATLLIGFSISQVVPSVSSINVIAGSGIIIGTVDDDIPDNSNFNVSFTAIGVLHTSKRQLLHFYPNPATEVIHLNKNSDECFHSYSIHNLSGVCLKYSELSCEETSIVVESLPKGLYTLQLFGENRVYVNSFVRQ